MLQSTKVVESARATTFEANFHVQRSDDPQRAAEFVESVRGAVVAKFGDQHVSIATLEKEFIAVAVAMASPGESWLVSLVREAVELWAETARVTRR